MRKWLGRHRRSVTALITIGYIAVAGIGYDFSTLRSERDRIEAETAERIAAITAKKVEQNSADKVMVNPGGQNDRVGNGTPDVFSLNSLSEVRDLLSSLFESSDPVALETETRTSPIRHYSGNRIGDGIANPIEVLLDGAVIATVTPSSNVDYTRSLFDLPNLAVGRHDISFQGINDADATSFIDAVSLSLANPTGS